MFGFSRSKMLHQSCTQILNIRYLQNPFLKCHSQTNPTSSSAQHLQKSSGISLEQALKASKNLSPKTATRNIDSVLLFLKSQGFSEAHIKSVITKAPQILNYAHPDSRIGPKMEFFREKGLSQPEVVNLMTVNPIFLTSSLEEWIKPKFSFIKGILGTEEVAIEWLKHKRLFCLDRLVVNVTTLKEYGIPSRFLSKLLFKERMALELNPDRFKENVKMVKEMGLSLSTYKFLLAVVAMTSLSRSTWDEKVKVYKSCGWSDDQIYSAFCKDPFCMQVSEEKIRRVMDFFGKELGWSARYLSSYPWLLHLSLEKRTTPRHKFLQILASKGLITMGEHGGRFIMGNERFFENYVVKYQKKFPDIFKTYEDILGSKKASEFQEL
ncbi:hypothetical protein ACLOJK_025012 [Asimina triloba]